MINAIIVDDEQPSIERLSHLLATYCHQSVRVIGTAQSVEEAIDTIRKHEPDLVFLDVQLHSDTAFDLLRKLGDIHFAVVFTTAFEKYAVQAFRFSAIDYLLKPIDPDDLQVAVARLKEKMSREEMSRKLDVLFHNLKTIQGVSKKISVPTVDGLVFLDVYDIIRCQSDGNYTIIFLKDPPRKVTVAKTLKEFDELLTDYNFFRVHHSHLVNLAHIKKYHKGKGGYVSMNDNSEVEVSTRRKDEFLKRLAEL